jgi:hypothetical protein
MFRKLMTPIMLRFQSTPALLDALNLLERGYTNPKCTVARTELEFGMCVIARELLRRKVIFWT